MSNVNIVLKQEAPGIHWLYLIKRSDVSKERQAF